MYLERIPYFLWDRVFKNYRVMGTSLDFVPGEIILYSKRKGDLKRNEKSIRYFAKVLAVEKLDEEVQESIEKPFYNLRISNSKEILTPFNLEDIFGERASKYIIGKKLKKIDPEDEEIIIPLLKY